MKKKLMSIAGALMLMTALERGRQPGVREFGEMMVKAHSAANMELKAIAGKKG